MKDKLKKAGEAIDWRVAVVVAICITALQIVNQVTVQWDGWAWIATFGTLMWLVKSPIDIFKK